MYRGHIPGDTPIYQLSREVIKEHVRDRSLFVDLGSRHGEGLQLIGDLCEGDYVMVEPSPRCISVINQLLSNVRSSCNPVLVPGVLGTSPGKIAFRVFPNDDDQSGNLYTDRGGTYGQPDTIDVDVYPISSVLKGRRINFAKVNIEGGEYQLIDDGFFDLVDAFVMEAHNSHVPGKTWTDIVDTLGGQFNINSTWIREYKYCALIGIRI